MVCWICAFRAIPRSWWIRRCRHRKPDHQRTGRAPA
jgi:hypothetical protein